METAAIQAIIEAVVIESTLNPVQEEVQMTTGVNVTNQTKEQIAAPPAHDLTLTIDDLDDFRKWQADKRNRRISELSKPYGTDVGSRRNTLVLRRVDCKEIAPDADVLAYLRIYAMKETVKSEGKKVQVTESEIKAYLELDFDFMSTPTLQDITEKAKELGGTESDDQEYAA